MITASATTRSAELHIAKKHCNLFYFICAANQRELKRKSVFMLEEVIIRKVSSCTELSKL
jgi:hypothetical protein